jgi:hypothetical protein
MTRSHWVYRKLRNFRAGIEAGISCLKRAYGGARCTWRGLDHFKAYIWSAVVAYNLTLLARLKPAEPPTPASSSQVAPAKPAWPMPLVKRVFRSQLLLKRENPHPLAEDRPTRASSSAKKCAFMDEHRASWRANEWMRGRLVGIDWRLPSEPLSQLRPPSPCLLPLDSDGERLALTDQDD